MTSTERERSFTERSIDEDPQVTNSKTSSTPSLTKRIGSNTNRVIFRLKKYKLFNLNSTINRACAFAAFIGLSTLAAVFIVYYTSPTPTSTACTFVLRSEAVSSIRDDSHPHSIAVGDFDRDGLLDLIVPNSGTNNVGVFLQNSNRTFKGQMTYSTGLRSTPYAVAVADFNGDQRLDIAVANFGAHTIGIFLGTGNGTFQAQLTFSTGSSRPRWVATGDFNNDQRIDLALANGGTNDIGIFTGDGHGNFMNWKTFTTGFDSIPYSLAVADLNHDSRLDIAVVNSGTGNVGVFLGYGNGSLTAQTIFEIDSQSSPYWVSIADVDKDSHMDIVVVCPNTNIVAILRGRGDGLFSIATKYSTGSNSAPRSVVIGNFDDDTNVDIVVATYATSSLMVLFGRGDGSFADSAVFYSSKDSNPYAVTAGHFNNDSRLDLAIVNYDYNYVDIVLTHRNYSFMSSSEYHTTGVDSKATSIAVADLNNDARSDLVVMNFKSNVLNIFLGNADGSFTRSVDYTTAAVVQWTFDPVSNSNGGVYGNSGSSSRASFPAATDAGPTSIAVADLNNDARLDIVVVNYVDANIGIFFGYGNGAFSEQTKLSTGSSSGPCAVRTADLNGDNQTDIVVALYQVDSIGVFLGNGSGGFLGVKTLPMSSGSRPIWVGVADFNRDSQPDIAVVNNLNGNVGVFFGSANGTFSYQTVFSVGTGAGPNGAAIGDVNGDGAMDLLVNIYYNRVFEILLGLGNGSFVSNTKYSVGSRSRPSWSTIADWNNDRRPDIIVSSCNTSSILVFFGEGDGTFLRPQTYFTGTDSCPLSSDAGYFNNDTLLDLAVANGKTNAISVFLAFTFMNGLREETYSTGSASHPRGVALGHFTNDRQLDTVMANSGLGQLGFVKGYPNGSFPSQQMFSTGVLSFPTSVAVADLNNDQKQDVIVANSLSGNVGVFYGHGNGTFTSQRTYSASSSFSPKAVICADFNHDNRTDIAVLSSDSSSSVSVMLKYDRAAFRKNSESFTGPNSYPHAVAVGDFNNDGRPDFVTVNRGSESISIFLGLGNGTFSGPTQYAAGEGSPSYAVIVGHFTNDTSLDIVVSHYWTKRISLFRGHGNGTFALSGQFETVTVCQPIGLAAGDLNKDRRLDVVAVCEKNGRINIFFGTGDEKMFRLTSLVTNTNATQLYAAVADFDNDTNLDIAVTDTNSQGIFLLFGSGDEYFSNIRSYSTGSESRPRPIAAADLNRDGAMDIVVGNSGTDTVCVFLGFGNGSFPNGVHYPIDSGSTSYGLVVSDLNGDAQLDVAVAGYGGNAVAVLLGLVNGTFFNALTFSTGLYSQPSFLAVADFNNDARPDLVVSESGVHRAGVYLGYADQDFLFAPAYSFGSGSQPVSIATGDLNNDTHLDAIVADNATDNVVVLFGSGVGTFSRADFYSTGNGSRPCSVAVADLNNDHRLDIVVANSNADCVGVFLGNGSGTFLNQIAYFTGLRSKPYAVALLDFDGDARLDVAVANYESSNVIIFPGRGNGSFSTAQNFSTGFGSHPFGLAVGDVNNDHLTDIVVTNNGYGNIAVLMKTC